MPKSSKTRSGIDSPSTSASTVFPSARTSKETSPSSLGEEDDQPLSVSSKNADRGRLAGKKREIALISLSSDETEEEQPPAAKKRKVNPSAKSKGKQPARSKAKKEIIQISDSDDPSFNPGSDSDASAKDLELEIESEVATTSKKPRAKRAAPKSKRGKKKSSSEQLLEQPYAEDSDEELLQLQAAIKSSKSTKGKKKLTAKAAVSDIPFVDVSFDTDSEEDETFMVGINDDLKAEMDANPVFAAGVRAVRAGKAMSAVIDAPVAPIRAQMVKKLGRKLTRAEKDTCALQYHHPELKDLWGDLENQPKAEIVAGTQPTGLKLNLLPFQLESLHWMKKQEASAWRGGCLADEMGMGKTIQMISLLLSDMRKPNLIITPTVAVMQWKNEIEAHTDGFKVLVWHGAGRDQDEKKMKEFDVVLTTFAVLESVFRKQEKGFKRKGDMVQERSVLHTIFWNRVILDEAHHIKQRDTNTARAAFQLKASTRWALTGTPIMNRVGEFAAIIRFITSSHDSDVKSSLNVIGKPETKPEVKELKAEVASVIKHHEMPYSKYFCRQCPCSSLSYEFIDMRHCRQCGHAPSVHSNFWNNEILGPIQKHGMSGTIEEKHPGAIAYRKLRILLDRMMLRRTKLERADDLGLPPRTIIIRRDFLSPEERELYLSLFSDVKRQFSTYEAEGTVLNNYSNIFSLILRMRQMACHPDLVLKSLSGPNAALVADSSEVAVCRICADVAEDPLQSKCRHIFCRECIKQYIEDNTEEAPPCPVCYSALTIDVTADSIEEVAATVKGKQGILSRLNMSTWRSSTKIEALVEELTRLRNEDATTKSIVFSQFISHLDLIAWRLQRAGFSLCRLEGTMAPSARDATIKHFMNTVSCGVFLVSLRAGGVALNLTEASRVFLMDPWWHESAERQAMDRIHRLGQHRPVECYKMICAGTIEEKIVELQQKKSAMVDAALSSNSGEISKLSVEDMSFLFRL